ncbi:hypothetical protein KIPB_013170, partial [Kipferlia bialata]
LLLFPPDNPFPFPTCTDPLAVLRKAYIAEGRIQPSK